MTEYRMGRPRTVTDKPLKKPKPNEPLELLGRLHKAGDTKARRVLVAEAMGDMFYIWGKVRKPWKPYLTYEENMNEPNGERV
jgi:hypothetical protein